MSNVTYSFYGSGGRLSGRHEPSRGAAASPAATLARSLDPSTGAYALIADPAGRAVPKNEPVEERQRWVARSARTGKRYGKLPHCVAAGIPLCLRQEPRAGRRPLTFNLSYVYPFVKLFKEGTWIISA